jgi:hypothetical protein
MKLNKIFQGFSPPVDVGNEQKSRTQNRLSKPKTKSSSTLLAATEIPQDLSPNPSVNSRTSTFSDTEAVIALLPGQHQVRPDARQKLRAQLFELSASSDTEYAVEDEGDGGSSYGDMEHNAKSSLSKSDSFSSRLSNARASSSNLLTTLTGSRLSLVPESHTLDTQEPIGLAPRELEEIEDKIRLDRKTSTQRLSMPGSRTFDEAGPSPIRRKSFLPPGIATRGGFDHPLRKRPPPRSLETDADHDYYYNPNIPESSPLSRIAAMDGHLADRSSPSPRASTPDESLDYSHLAGFRRGTLRITNGVASPAPSIDTAQSTTQQDDGRNDEAFFSASEGIWPEDEGSRMNTTLVRRHSSVYTRYGHEQSHEHGNDLPNSGHTVISIQTTKTRYRARSPLRFDGRMVNHVDRSRVASEAGTVIRRKSLSSSEAGSIPDLASSMAQEYQELAVSPFMFDDSPAQSPKLEATSKTTEFDAELFDDEYEGSTFESEPSSVRGGTREAAFRILDGEASPPSNTFRLSPGPLDPHATEHPNEIEKPLSKADSGYSSTTSVRSYRNGPLLLDVVQDSTDDQLIQEGPGNLGKALPPPPMRTAPTLPPQISSGKMNLIPRKALPNIADRALSGFFERGLEGVQEKQLPQTPVKNLPGVPIDKLNYVTDLEEPPCAECIRFRQGQRQPKEQEQQEQQKKQVQTKKKPDSVANARKKLQKQRPMLQPAVLPAKFITVQRYREIEQQHIPPIPSEIASRHANRSKTFSALEHTFQSFHHTKKYPESKSPSPQTSPPSWRFPNLYTKQKLGRRHSVNAGAHYHDAGFTARPSPAREYFSFQQDRLDQPPSWQMEPDFATSITDFGTVAQSLGSSPYDVALSAAAYQPRRDSHRSSLSAHQTGAVPRLRSYVGMTEEEASEYARERSLMRRNSGTPNFSRPRSMYESRGSLQSPSGLEGPVLQGRCPRPQLMILDAPPMPSLPRAYTYANTQESELARNTRMNRAMHVSFEATGDPSSIEAQSSLQASPEGITQQLSQSWAQHRAAWKERRRSAGEALTGVKAAPNQATIPGRYDGGFEYDYEPGIGCGGSAGIRNMTMNASRKSVGVSQDYGIDFSDVPVFVRG